MVTFIAMQGQERQEKATPPEGYKKLNDTCISRMYVDYYGDGRVTVMYIIAHTNHQPGSCENAYLPLPKSVQEEIAIKLCSGIPPERIMEGTVQTKFRQHVYTIIVQ